MTSIEIASGWQFRQAGHAEWRPASVPGCIHLDLLAAGAIPDPFFADHEARLQWIGRTAWQYRVVFDVNPAALVHEHVDLVFDGLDTYATVRLNGAAVLEADNMFRTWRVGAKRYLRAGANELHIAFRPAVDEVLPRLAAPGAGLPAINDPGEKTSPFTRKAPYHYGWDWGPRFVTAGVWRPVRLEAWSTARIDAVFATTTAADAREAELRIDVTLASPRAAADVRVECSVALDGEGSAAPLACEAVDHGTEAPAAWAFTCHVSDPQRWWPAGYGGQPLYAVTVTARDATGDVLDVRRIRTGIRTLELRRLDDQWGRSFEFVVNGVPVFAKGANWIPADSFLARITSDRYRQLLQSARDANMNMLRAWGGGIYEADAFYEIADELGLLIWQDLVFSCAMYPADEAFLASVRAEVTDNVRRLRNHPSIALWCGNNEIEMGWHAWGWADQWPARLWADYERLFHRELPAVLAAEDPSRAYWPSSPGSHDPAHARSIDHGDMHYWGVWHAAEPFSAFEQQAPRFMSEYGFQSFPELRTVESYAAPGQFDIGSPAMTAHQKHPRGNQLIREYLLREYPEPRDFVSFLYVSQVLQAEGIKRGTEHLRRMRPRTMGALFWQLNDCWPVASWSSVDYFGRWKALHYYARRFFGDVLVSVAQGDGRLVVHGTSDRQQPTEAQLSIRLVSFDGRIRRQQEQGVSLRELSSAPLAEIDVSEALAGADPAREFLDVALHDETGTPLSENRWFFLPMKALALPRPRIEWTVAVEDAVPVVTLSSAQLARHVEIACEAADGRFEDNFFDLLPGRAVRVRFLDGGKTDPAAFRRSLRVRSIVDAF